MRYLLFISSEKGLSFHEYTILFIYFPSLFYLLFDFENVLSAFADPRISEGGFVRLYFSVYWIYALQINENFH